MSRPLALITGASSGIGLLFARKLAPSHDLVLVARRADRLDTLAAQLVAAHGTKVEVHCADLSEASDLNRVAGLIGTLDNLALLVNNAGFGHRGAFWEADLSALERMHRLHVMAIIKLTHAALRPMVAKNRGAVINVASVAAFAQRAGSASYGASKAWLTAFSEGLYLDLQRARSAVTVQALCPGFTYSEFHDLMNEERLRLAPAGFWLTADAVVDASLKGLSRQALFVVPGWRYALLVAVLRALPAWLKLRLEGMGRGGKPSRLDKPPLP